MSGTRSPGGPPRNTPERGTSRSGETTSRSPGPGSSTGTIRSGRSPRTHPSLLDLTARLTARDLVLARLLAEHKVLTHAQITQVLFTAPGTAANRLARLRRWGVLDRFTPPRSVIDTLPEPRGHTCWILGVLGARYVALSDAQRPPTAHAVRERQDAIAASTHLGHTLGVNQVFVDLLAHTRTHPDTHLARWWASARISAALGRRVCPDAHGIWSEGDRQVAWLLEYDTGSEALAHLAAKIVAYRRLRTDGGPAWPVLFHLPGPVREQNLHRHLAAAAPWGSPASPGTGLGRGIGLGAEVVVATTTRERHQQIGPAAPLWRLVGDPDPPRRMIDLPCAPGRPGPYHPGPPTPHEDPLHLQHPGEAALGAHRGADGGDAASAQAGGWHRDPDP